MFMDTQSLKRMADRITARRGPVERGLYAGTYAIRDRVKHLVSRQSTIGKKLWRSSEAGSKRSNLGTYIRPAEVKHRGQTMAGGLELYGLPAMIEAGGKTKSHPIFPKGAKRGRGRGLRFIQGKTTDAAGCQFHCCMIGSMPMRAAGVQPSRSHPGRSQPSGSRRVSVHSQNVMRSIFGTSRRQGAASRVIHDSSLRMVGPGGSRSSLNKNPPRLPWKV